MVFVHVVIAAGRVWDEVGIFIESRRLVVGLCILLVFSLLGAQLQARRSRSFPSIFIGRRGHDKNEVCIMPSSCSCIKKEYNVVSPPEEDPDPTAAIRITTTRYGANRSYSSHSRIFCPIVNACGSNSENASPHRAHPISFWPRSAPPGKIASGRTTME